VADPVGSSSKDFAAYIRNEYEKYDKVIKALGSYRSDRRRSDFPKGDIAQVLVYRWQVCYDVM